MEIFKYWCLGIIALAIATIVFVLLYSRYKTKQILNRISKMLELAIKEEFTESAFDESLLSAVEVKFAHYLSASAVSSKVVAQEKNKITELISDISHQTKTPIANIVLYSELLREQSIPAESKQYTQVIIEQSEKLSFLISSLIKMSRLEAGIFTLNAKQDKIQPLLDKIQKQTAYKAQSKNISINIELTDVSAFFDSKWTLEAIYNIVDNAVKYTDGGGIIQISVISYELFCCIQIADNGIGILEDEIAKIFARFYRSQTVNDVEGVGIGLFLARKIISSQGGYIKVSSKIGKGSVFSVYLPKKE